jgi:REP element-mobilizing transposase RayT
MTTSSRRRRSIRIPGHDYTRGTYFVTIVTFERQCLLGDVVDGEVQLGDMGMIVTQEWLLSAELRPEIGIDEFVVMPNHFHGIVTLLRPQSLKPSDGARDAGPHGRAPRGTADQPSVRAPRSLGSFIAGFKGAATARINAVRGMAGVPVWQRNYHERIIRSEDELTRTRQYILDNPLNWPNDPENRA